MRGRMTHRGMGGGYYCQGLDSYSQAHTAPSGHPATKTPDFLLHKRNSPQTQKSGICHAWNGCTPLCRQGACRNPAEMFHVLVVAASCWGDSQDTLGGTPCPTALQQELLGVSNSSGLTQCHNIPVFQTGRGSDATSSTRLFLLTAQHSIQAQSGQALGLKFTEH